MRSNGSRTSRSRALRAAVALSAAALAATTLAACGEGSGSSGDELRLGYFPNLTHATALLGVKQGYLQKALGVTGPEAGKDSALDSAAFFDTIGRVVEQYPGIKVVATTLREVHSTNRHSWSAVAWFNGEQVTAPTTQLDVLDRVGGGDGFASGLIYGLLSGESPEQSVRLGWAHGALITTFPGDTTMATLDEVRAFAKGGSARIQR